MRFPFFSQLLLLILLSSCKYEESPSLALAKEFCSCLYTAEQDEAYCESITEEARILAGYKVYLQDKVVLARGMDHFAAAQYTGPQYGCFLLHSKRVKKRRRGNPRNRQVISESYADYHRFLKSNQYIK